MLAKFSARRPQGAVPSGRAQRKLDAALTGLPGPWRVLRNRRARAADGPPWTKYIALHPAKGIALLDLFPANPHAAIAPLDEFLARTGFLAFSRGDPPIVAIALTERDIGDVAKCLVDGFAAAQPCGIQNPNWADAVVDLLVSTPGLLLTPLDRASNRAAPSDGQRAPQRDVPRSDGHRAPAHDVPQTPHFKVEPSAAPSGAESRQFGAKGKPRASRLPREPQHRPAPEPASPEPRLGVTVEPDLRIDRLSSFVRRRRWRVVTPLILGASAAAVIFAISFPQWHTGFFGPKGPPENAAQQAVEIPSAPPVESLLPRASPPPDAQNVAPPEKSVPQPKIATTEPPAKTAMPPAKRDAGASGSATAAAPRATANHAPTDAKPPQPKQQPKVAATEPSAKTAALPSKQSAGSSSNAGATTPHAVANRTPPVAPPDRGENAHAQASLRSPRSTDTHPPEAAPPEPPQNEETITINGVTYVQGRQPHALGMVSEPLPGTGESSSQPIPPVRDGGADGVLIQPLQ